MQENNYDARQADNVENTVKVKTGAPIELKKLCGKMIIAMIVYAIAAAGLSTVLTLLVGWIYGSVKATTQGFGLAWNALDNILKQVLYFLIPALFAGSACKSFTSRVSFLGCFYLQDVIGGIFMGAANIIKGQVSGFTGDNIVLFYIASAVLFLAAYALEIVVLVYIVKRAYTYGLFSQEVFYHSLYQSKSRRKAPVAAAVCCVAFKVLNVAVLNVISYLLQVVFHKDSAFVSSVHSNMQIILRIIAVLVFYAVGKYVYKQKSGGLLFTACIIGISVLNCAGSFISLIFNGVPGVLEVSGVSISYPIPYFTYVTVVSLLGIIADTVVAALLGYFIFKRLNRRSEPSKPEQPIRFQPPAY